ncbi:MAG TPA: hypothetical protein QF564_14945, partial [Pirellulaceae bacterium]|nr:hypothetical protein [Pirellulaceae bacterium]
MGFPAARVGLYGAVENRNSLAIFGATSFGQCGCARRTTAPKQSLSGLFTSGTSITARRFVSPEYASPEYASPEYASPEYASPEYASQDT